MREFSLNSLETKNTIRESFIAGCTQLAGFGVRKSPDNADKRWLMAMQASCISRMSTEVQYGDVSCGGDDKLAQSCYFPLHKFGQACVT